jgi:hypothetical protein
MGGRAAREVGTENGERLAIHSEAFDMSAGRRRRGVAERDTIDGGMRRGGDAVTRDANIHGAVVAA